MEDVIYVTLEMNEQQIADRINHDIALATAETTRKLATIRRVDALDPIEGADKIEVATIGGWKVVTQKSIHKVGDLVLYIETDAWVPNWLAPFLTKPGHHVKEYNGVAGERLRTIKLKGTISQGLILSLSSAFEISDGCINIPYNKDTGLGNVYLQNKKSKKQ